MSGFASTAAGAVGGATQPQQFNIDPTPEALRPIRDQLAQMVQARISAPTPAPYNPFPGAPNPFTQLFGIQPQGPSQGGSFQGQPSGGGNGSVFGGLFGGLPGPTQPPPGLPSQPLPNFGGGSGNGGTNQPPPPPPSQPPPLTGTGGSGGNSGGSSGPNPGQLPPFAFQSAAPQGSLASFLPPPSFAGSLPGTTSRGSFTGNNPFTTPPFPIAGGAQQAFSFTPSYVNSQVGGVAPSTFGRLPSLGR